MATPTYLWLLLVVMAFNQVTGLKIIDLSHKHSADALVSNYHHPRFNRSTLEKGRTTYGLYVEAGWYSTAEHGGTHLDAPAHIVEGGNTLDKIPIEHTVLDGVMIDCSKEANADPVYGVTKAKILAWEKENGRIPDEAAVLFNFNWSRHFYNELVYKGIDDVANFAGYKFPYVSEEAAMWLLRERKPRLISADTLTPDPYSEGDKVLQFPIHQHYLKDNRLILENIRDPGRLPARGFRFYAVPVAFKENTGAQVRAFAIINEQENGSSRPCGHSLVIFISLVSLVVAAVQRLV